jgi:hypothetical protein
MAFESKDGEFALFRNDPKDKDGDPDYRGDGKVNGIEVRAAGWINEMR